MTINEVLDFLLNDRIIGTIVILSLIIKFLFNGLGDFLYNFSMIKNKEDSSREYVKIVAKTTTRNPFNRKALINYLISETKDGTRLETIVQNSDVLRSILVGDTGYLFYKQNKFVSFTRTKNQMSPDINTDNNNASSDINTDNKKAKKSPYATSQSHEPQEPIPTDNKNIICPLCHTEQPSYRKTCWGCGVKFEKK